MKSANHGVNLDYISEEMISSVMTIQAPSMAVQFIGSMTLSMPSIVSLRYMCPAVAHLSTIVGPSGLTSCKLTLLN